jgi:xanthine dehydrogenase accessory factor
MITDELAREAQRLLAGREPFVQATVVRAVAPTSVRPGDTALVLADGTIKGFVGGTCAQTSVRLHAARALAAGEGVLLRLVPGVPPAADETDAEPGVIVAHNPCLSGGALDIFLDPQLPAPRVVIAGDTPIARRLHDVAAAAGYDVVRDTAADVAPRPGDAAVIVASHGNDEEIALVRALQAGVDYVALVASPTRGAAVLASLDVPAEHRDRVHTPAGLDIGARAPADVAIAILAEFVAQRAGADAPPAVTPAAPSPLATAIDPICGMEVVATDASLHLDVDGERLYFCREGCRATYLEEHRADVAAR